MATGQSMYLRPAVFVLDIIALQLRYLETLTELAAEKNSTILFPVPIDLLQGLTDLLNNRSA